MKVRYGILQLSMETGVTKEDTFARTVIQSNEFVEALFKLFEEHGILVGQLQIAGFEEAEYTEVKIDKSLVN